MIWNSILAVCNKGYSRVPLSVFCSTKSCVWYMLAELGQNSQGKWLENLFNHSAHLGVINPSAVSRSLITCHNSADSVPTSNLICIKEVAIRTTFSHMINFSGKIYYTCSLVIDILCTHYKNAFNKRF